MNCPFLTKILPSTEESPYKLKHSEQNYVRSCNSASAIAYCYQRLCLVQKFGKMYCQKEPENFGIIPIKLVQIIFPNNRLCQLFCK